VRIGKRSARSFRPSAKDEEKHFYAPRADDDPLEPP